MPQFLSSMMGWLYRLSDVILGADDAPDDERMHATRRLLTLGRAIAGTHLDPPANAVADMLGLCQSLHAVSLDPCSHRIVQTLQLPPIGSAVDVGEIEFADALSAPWPLGASAFAVVVAALDATPREDEDVQWLLFNFWRWLHNRDYDPLDLFVEQWRRS